MVAVLSILLKVIVKLAVTGTPGQKGMLTVLSLFIFFFYLENKKEKSWWRKIMTYQFWLCGQEKRKGFGWRTTLK